MKSVSMNKPSAGDPVYLTPWLGTIAVFAAYVLVNLWLYQRVMDLIAHAANPFFVVVLVVITVLGQVLTIWQAKRILAEGRQVDLLNGRVKAFARDGRTQGAALEQELLKDDRNFDIDRLLRQLKNADGQTIRFDRIQLQHQFDGFAGDLQRRTLLPQYIANTLIGLGLFGTFLGLIVTLKEVALLIGMFSSIGTEGGSDMMGKFFERMSGPLAGMGDAFVASLLGLGGSIVNNVQLLACKKLQRLVTARAEGFYMNAAEFICTNSEDIIRAAKSDTALAESQLQEIRTIRGEMCRQTDAILLATSRMRQASEPLAKGLEALQKQLSAQAQDRPQLEQIAAAMEQRLGSLVNKFEETRQAHQGLMGAVSNMETHLGELAKASGAQTEQQQDVSRKLSELSSTTVQQSELCRNALRENSDQLRTTLHEDLHQIGMRLDESLRDQREQGQMIAGIQGSARSVVVAVETAGVQLLQQGEQLPKQITDLIARIEKIDLSLEAAKGGSWQLGEVGPAPEAPAS
ncbi:biopolymer transport protein ExbB/TolQ/uncharacterized protein YoxC [Herbaspirillum seropedicae]|uniref:centriolin protein n=1 Tax=Herbaspirillum seropedicae TaxID=964 RepID=UPI0033930B33